MFSGPFFEKWMSIRERNKKFLLETVTYMATTETAICMITIKTVMSIMYCRKHNLQQRLQPGKFQ